MFKVVSSGLGNPNIGISRNICRSMFSGRMFYSSVAPVLQYNVNRVAMLTIIRNNNTAVKFLSAELREESSHEESSDFEKNASFQSLLESTRLKWAPQPLTCGTILKFEIGTEDPKLGVKE